MIKKLFIIVIVLALVPVWAGCGGFPDNAVAEVDGKVITREDLDFRMDQLRQLYGELPDTESEEYKSLEKQAVEQLVNEQIIVFEAEDMDIHVTDEEVDEAIDERVEAIGGQEIYEQQLEAAGTTVDREMQQVRNELLFQKIFPEVVKDGPQVTDEQVLAYYNENIEQFTNAEEQRQVRHILVETEEEAIAVIARLDAGEDFAVLAMELSTDTGSGAAGGELGAYPSTESGLVPEFEVAMAALVAGERSGPVQSEFGFHIIEVTAIIPPGPMPFDEIKDQLKEQYQALEFDYNYFGEWLENIRENYEIIYADEFEPDEEETQTGTSTDNTNEAAEPAATE
jgi:parvulin-like peptidyl-prolyl isomerase